jgi:adenylyl-sulfate kinase
MIFWLYGPSGAGKTTLATRLEKRMAAHGMPALMLDGDAIRSGLSSDIGFSPADRIENHRRIAEIARLVAQHRLHVVCATMAPQHAQRDVIHRILGDSVRWIYVHAPVEVCAHRDPKGLYARSEHSIKILPNDPPFDPPRNHECHLQIDTALHGIDECVSELCRFVMATLKDAASSSPQG